MTPEEEWDEMMRLSKLLSNADDVVRRATIDAERARKEFYDFVQAKIDRHKAKALLGPVEKCEHAWGPPSCTTGQKVCQKCLTTLFHNGEIMNNSTSGQS